jgi:pimeloyl-[acyl-carrier protein] methyl ester esterase
MQIAVSGQGRDLVLIHGWAMHAGIFAPLAARLRPHCRLHEVDLPGHGSSPVRDWPGLEACATQLAERIPPGAIWLGWSLGGLVALRAAQRAAAAGLVMLCATPRFPAGPDWPQGVAVEVLTRFAQELGQDFRATIERFLALEAMGSDHLRDDLRALRQHVFERGEPSPSALRDGLDLLLKADLRAQLPGLGLPSLWIAGRRDRLVSPAAMREAAALAGGRFGQIEGGGHAPFLSHADEVAEAMLGFIRLQSTIEPA